MYVRRDTKKVEIKGAPKGRGRVNVKEVTYLSIAHNVVEDSPKGKRTKPIVFANLGPEENFTGEMARSLAGAFGRYAAKRLGETKPSEADLAKVAEETRATSPYVRLLASKELGMRLLLAAPWRALGIGAALAKYEKKHRMEFPLERVVFAMVLNRLVDPKSKLACNDWVQERAYMPEANGWQVQHFYRALDILHEHWKDLEDVLAKELDALLSDEERRQQLIDTTTLYFEAEMTDREIAALNAKWDDFEKDGTLKEPRRPRPEMPNKDEFRMRGHNKDGHPECPQVKIALVCAPGGTILRHQVYAGNKADSTITKDLVVKLPKPLAGTVRVWVADAGMMGTEQIALLDGAGWERVSAEPLRKSELGKKLFKAQGGQYHKDPTRPHIRYHIENVAAEDSPSGKAETWVFTRNERERERQLEMIERHLDEVAEDLARKPGKNMAHAKAVCNIASHVSLKKYIMPSTKVPGTYVMDQDAIAWERRLAGVRCYRTTLLDLDGPTILATYSQLQDVEAMNKTFKHPLALRPCYHRVERRIKAHVMLTVLAANCAKYMEQKTGLTLEKLRALAAGVHAHDIEQGSKRHWQRSEVDPAFEQALKALGMDLPAIIWTKWIEPGTKAKKRKKAGS